MSDKGTKVKLVIGETIIPAVLNDSKPARALLAKLPYSVKLQRYEHDYCGVMSETLPYDAAELRSGWKNGDIAFAVNGNYFAILYKDEEISQQYDGMVTMGALDCSPSVMETLAGSISVSIEQD
ncbi:cyclophilin-like fold protein [Pseudodesulfovibrio cashew]|nr:cyclophilin-like fold protein [Pseudodesulfovibrio cashew]